jgi:hypothetical protein
MELLVSIGVLVLLILLATHLLNSAATITTLGHKQMDADSQARQLFDRMALDFAQMVKRPDVDYFLQSSVSAIPDCTTCVLQNGNDRMAFFGSVPGYYPTSSYQSPISLIAYRVNSNPNTSSYNKLERLGKGFIWNGVSNYIPILFLDSPTAPTTTIGNKWPAAVSSSLDDPDGNYEIIGPQVFRFEYYYLLKTGSLSRTPWNTIAGHTNVTGMRDVAAIVADIAVLDPKGRAILDNSAQVPPPNDNVTLLAGTLIDYGASAVVGCPTPNWQSPGELRRQWQCVLDSTNVLPRQALSGIRLYERYFYLYQANL